jgi:hypothetical protein
VRVLSCDAEAPHRMRRDDPPNRAEPPRPKAPGQPYKNLTEPYRTTHPEPTGTEPTGTAPARSPGQPIKNLSKPIKNLSKTSHNITREIFSGQLRRGQPMPTSNRRGRGPSRAYRRGPSRAESKKVGV